MVEAKGPSAFEGFSADGAVGPGWSLAGVVTWHAGRLSARARSGPSQPGGRAPLGERPANPTRGAGRPSVRAARVPTPVATKIKLMRIGKMREPHYRIVVADARTK